NGYGSAALADAPAFDRHDLARRRRLYQFFGQFFGDAEQHFPPPHFGPDVVRTHPRMGPEHHEVVDEIGAFAHNRLGLAVHGVDDDFDRLFRELLGHFGPAGAKQLRGPRFGGVGPLRGDHGVIETGDRISHAGRIS